MKLLMNALVLLTVNAQFKYTKEIIMEFGDNCFGKGGGESTSAETSGAVKITDMETSEGNADVKKIIVDPGTNCWFESYGDFFISGDEHLDIKYVPYKGYASQIALYGEEKSCVF